MAHRYDTSARLSDPDSTLNRVARLVGPNRRVIDFGSGPGILARVLVQNGCRVTLVDGDPEALRVAAAHGLEGYCVDLNDAAWPGCLPANERFDVAILADVLEHLTDPAATLRSVARFLAEDGRVVVSLPNVAYNGVLAGLWHGHFRYTDIGLLDRTHVRFFGAEDIEPLLASAGLVLEHVEFATTHPRHTEFAHDWDALPLRVRHALRLSRYGYVYQFVLSARPRVAGAKGIALETIPVPAVDDSLYLEFRRAISSLIRRRRPT